MPYAKPRKVLVKTPLGLNENSVAPSADVADFVTADQEIQIKKVMISGGGDQDHTIAFLMLPPGGSETEANALKPEYLIYRFGLHGTSGIIDFMDKPAIRILEGWKFGILVHNYSAANLNTIVQSVVWHYAV